MTKRRYMSEEEYQELKHNMEFRKVVGMVFCFVALFVFIVIMKYVHC